MKPNLQLRRFLGNWGLLDQYYLLSKMVLYQNWFSSGLVAFFLRGVTVLYQDLRHFVENTVHRKHNPIPDEMWSKRIFS